VEYKNLGFYSINGLKVTRIFTYYT